MKVAVLIPYRAGDNYRENAFRYVRQWWDQFPYEVCVAPGPDGLMNRSAARNEAARSTSWDVGIFADADTIGQVELIPRAVDAAAEGKLAYPFTEFEGLSAVGTRNFINGYGNLQVIKRKRLSPGGILAVPHDLYDEVGGYDEAFQGWGYEDLAFAYAAGTFAEVHREEGVITHLWHPNAPEKPKAIRGKSENRARKERYLAAAGDPEKMRALLEELQCSVS